MFLPRQLKQCLAIFAVAVATGCTVQLVAPHNSDLQQKASSMQAEVAAWDLTMRGSAGTIADDPRHPDVTATLNKWHGEADAMLTLAVSNDPGMINCSEASQAVSGTIQRSIPADLRAPTQATALERCQRIVSLGLRGGTRGRYCHWN